MLLRMYAQFFFFFQIDSHLYLSPASFAFPQSIKLHHQIKGNYHP